MNILAEFTYSGLSFLHHTTFPGQNLHIDTFFNIEMPWYVTTTDFLRSSSWLLTYQNRPSSGGCPVLVPLYFEVEKIILCFWFAGQALVNFRTGIISSDGILLQWRPEDEDPCRWKGVKCDPKSKRVIALWVPHLELFCLLSSSLFLRASQAF